MDTLNPEPFPGQVMLGDFLATMSIYIPYTYIPHMAMAKGVKVTS